MELPEDLSVHAIRVELHRRGLSTSGLKRELRARLAASFSFGECTEMKLSVPTRFQSPASTPSPSPPRTRKRRRTSRVSVVPAKGYWMGRSVWVTATDGMETLWTVSDSYGKGNLSRSQPIYACTSDEGHRGKAARQLQLLEKTAEDATTGSITARRDGVEHLQLSLAEAYHAAFVTGRLELHNTSIESLGTSSEVWALFCAQDARFAARFALYARYRDTGWIPRSGLKYGVDLVLYPLGTSKHSHAPYCVVISDTPCLERTWIRLQNKLRLVKNVAKSLIIVSATFETPPDNWEAAISSIAISELTVDRWVA